MATVTTALIPPVPIERFVSPGMRAGDTDGLPIGRVNLSFNFTTTGTGVGDTEDLSFQLDLDKNYFYRPLSIGATIYSGSGSDIVSWTNDRWLIEIQSSISTYYTALKPSTYWIDASTVENASRYQAATNSVFLEYVPENPTLFGQVIDGRTIARINVRAHNGNASIGAVSGNLRFTALQYTIEDSLAFPLWATGNLINR